MSFDDTIREMQWHQDRADRKYDAKKQLSKLKGKAGILAIHLANEDWDEARELMNEIRRTLDEAEV